MRYFKAILFSIFVLGVFSKAVFAEEVSGEDKKFFEGLMLKYQKMVKNNTGKDVPVLNLNPEVDLTDFKIKTNDGVKTVHPNRVEKKEVFYIFASFSIPEEDLMSIMDEAISKPDVQVVFRGVSEVDTLSGGIAKIQSMVERAVESYEKRNSTKVSYSDFPNVAINPIHFRTFNVKNVPEMVYAKGDSVLARARGIYLRDWMVSEYHQSGKVGDIGVFGNVYDILERDIVEQMKEAVLTMDLDGMKSKAIKRFWKERKFIKLPPAREDSERVLDPSVVVAEDIVANGEVIYEAGERFNPLEILPFTTQLVVYNGTDPRQRSLLPSILEGLDQSRRIQLVTTEVNRKDGWGFLEGIETEFGLTPYLLTQDVRDRFGIQNVPSLVTSRGKYFVVKEFGVKQ